MPTIPIITARNEGVTEGTPGVLRVPPVGPQSFGAGIGEGVSEFGQALFNVSQKLQNQRDELTLLDLSGQLDMAVPEMKKKAMVEPDLHKRPQVFQRMMEDQSQALMQQAEQNGTPISNAVKAAFLAHQKRTLPEHVINLQADSIKQMKDQNDAQESKVLADIVQSIPTFTEQGQRAGAMVNAREAIFRGVDSGIKTEAQATKQWLDFQQDVLASEMDYLRTTNRPSLYKANQAGRFDTLAPDRRVKIIAQANEDDRQEQTRSEQVFNKAKTQVEWYWSSQANQGKLSAEMIDRALTGQDGFITPDKAREYKKINDNPPLGGEDDVAIKTAMQWYHSGTSTRERINATRKKLNQLAQELGHPSTTLDKAFNELQTDERSQRSVEASEMAAKVSRGEDLMKSGEEPILFKGMLGALQKNVQEKNKAEMRMRIKKGEDPDKVVKDILERQKREQEAIPKRQQGVLDLVK